MSNRNIAYEILIEAREKAALDSFDRVHNASQKLRAQQEREDDKAFQQFIARQKAMAAAAEKAQADALATFQRRQAAQRAQDRADDVAFQKFLADERAEAAKRSGIAGLKRLFGEESTLGNLGKIAVGTGAVAGITLMLNALRDVTGEAVRLKTEFDAGRKSAGEVADELARSIPLLGQIYAAGRNIRELFTGDQAETARVLEDARMMNALMDARAKAAEAGKKAVAEMAREARHAQRDALAAGMGPELGARARAAFAASDEAAAIRRDAEAKAKALRDAEVEVDDGNGGKFKGTAAHAKLKIQGHVSRLEGELQDAREAAQRAAESFEAGGTGDHFAAGRIKAAQERLNTARRALSEVEGIEAQAEKDAAAVTSEANTKIRGAVSSAGLAPITKWGSEQLAKLKKRAVEQNKAWADLDLGPMADPDWDDGIRAARQRAVALMRAGSDEAGINREALLRLTGRGREADRRRLVREAEADVRRIQEEAAAAARERPGEAQALGRAAARQVAQRGLRLEIDSLALRRDRLEGLRQAPVFELQESRRLTGVKEPADSTEELLADVRKQAATLKQQLKAQEETRDALKALAEAAKNQKLLIAEFDGGV